ncbi:hypothetical protein AYX13_01411 [Cryptococcus neoformans]|nr:hypothetical protein AYX13_01411 [Cryptococcus neoformans var. grubii]
MDVDSRVTSPSQSATAGQSTVVSQKVPIKVSCLQCRAAKRKCNTLGAHATCRRCQGHNLSCEYAPPNRRGRKKKALSENHSKLTDSIHSVSVSGPPSRANAGPDEAPSAGGDEASGFYDSIAGTGQQFPPNLLKAQRYNGAVSNDASVRTLDGSAESSPLDRTSTVPSRSSTARTGSMPAEGIKGKFDIHYSNIIPGERNSLPSNAPNKDVLAQQQESLVQKLRPECPDPVTAGFLNDQDTPEIFDFYFRHLNAAVAILDPVLHTPVYCRHYSPLLFTAVVTVTVRVIRPKIYPQCLLLANKLVGQAVEFGLCSIEVVQTLCLLTHWKKPDDETSYVRMGYAIRMAQQLQLDTRAPRPLPQDERQAREVLNRERAWYNLVIADYHLAINHSLPKMITDDVEDPADWVAEHSHLPTPGDSSFGPFITFSRMSRLYADSLRAMNGDPSNMRMLNWMDLEWTRWRGRWLKDNERYGFVQFQISTFHLCDAFFRFHVCEYRLLFVARYESQGQILDISEPSPLSMAFTECADAAMGIGEVVLNDLVPYGYLAYCFNLTWPALAISAIWLAKNIEPMNGADRARVIRLLSDLQFAMEKASCSSDDMAAYTHRLLKHLLGGISPEWQLASFMTKPYPHPTNQNSGQTYRQNIPNTSVFTQNTNNTASSGPLNWAPSSAQELIQSYLWSQEPHHYFLVPPIDPAPAQSSAGEQPDMSQVSGVMSGEFQDLFPANDDNFWKHLFPSGST